MIDAGDALERRGVHEHLHPSGSASATGLISLRVALARAKSEADEPASCPPRRGIAESVAQVLALCRSQNQSTTSARAHTRNAQALALSTRSSGVHLANFVEVPTRSRSSTWKDFFRFVIFSVIFAITRGLPGTCGVAPATKLRRDAHATQAVYGPVYFAVGDGPCVRRSQVARAFVV
jgi:hypothetical protein